MSALSSSPADQVAAGGMAEPCVAMHGLAVGYGAVTILSGIEMTLRAGECWLIRGPNGSGKTTLLKTLAGMLPQLGGSMVSSPSLRLAYVPAETSLVTTLPLRLDEVVRMGAFRVEPAGLRYSSALRDREKRWLAETGLLPKRGQAFARSSSGEKQRALLARALMSEPHLLLLDEPTSNLDRESQAIFMGILARLREEHRVGMLISTHAHDQFAPLRARVIEVRDGTIRVS